LISIRHGTVRYNTVRYATVRYAIVSQYGTLQHGMVQYGTLQYGTQQYCTVRHSSTVPVRWGREASTYHSKVCAWTTVATAANQKEYSMIIYIASSTFLFTILQYATLHYAIVRYATVRDYGASIRHSTARDYSQPYGTPPYGTRLFVYLLVSDCSRLN